ncbi:MAG: tetratricopeptide repeat protein [Pirellulaceae bacterium]
MGKWRYRLLLLLVGVPLAGFAWWTLPRPSVRVPESEEQNVHAAQPTQEGLLRAPGKVAILYPRDGTMFPPEIVPPTIRWEDTYAAARRWLLTVQFTAAATPEPSSPASLQCEVDVPHWTPTDAQWEAIKRGSVDQPARIIVQRVGGFAENQILTSAAVRIVTSTDPVGAPIFYREVNLPFIDAVKDPAKMIRWRFGEISSPHQPPVVLEKMPICGNCHSFSADGQTLGMDVDFANDKGSYTISRVSAEMLLGRNNTITWSDYRRQNKKRTFGLLSQVSPDGRYVISTVKDLSVFLATDDLAFSQLFFPVQGILCYYDRSTASFHPLPGADDPKYVQSNPTWSPDGRFIVFARSEAYDVPQDRVDELGLSVPEEVPDFVSGAKTFLFDLYRIPFNDGQGGEPEPLLGASGNGKSNYFAKYSPDGKWIIFCQAKSFMLLQPDSELFIIPAEGGQARRLACNTERMNSWHSWSPNGRWLVFSSKAYTLYTQLMLTHVDDQGETTPPVVLSHFSAPDRAANIPEFVNTAPDAIKRITFDREFFADAISINAGDKYARQGDFRRAVEEFQKAVEANPDNVYAYRAWALALSQQGEMDEAAALLRKALKIAPEDLYVNWQLGQVLSLQGQLDEAERLCREAIRIDPAFASPYLDLATVLLRQGRTKQGRGVLQEAIRIRPEDPQSRCLLADSLLSGGEILQAIALYREALEKDADCVPAMLRLAQVFSAPSSSDPRAHTEAVQFATRACQLTNFKSAEALITLSDAHAVSGNREDAASAAYRALQVASQSGNREHVNLARARLEKYGQ